MNAIAVLLSSDHRAFANINPKPQIEPVVYLFVQPDEGVEYIAIDAPGDEVPPRAIHLESPIGGGWHRVEIVGLSSTTLKVAPLTAGTAQVVTVVL